MQSVEVGHLRHTAGWRRVQPGLGEGMDETQCTDMGELRASAQRDV